MTVKERKKINELLAKIAPGVAAAKGFFDACFDDSFSGRIDVSRPKMTKALEDADKAIAEMTLYVIGFDKEENNGVNTEKKLNSNDVRSAEEKRR